MAGRLIRSESDDMASIQDDSLNLNDHSYDANESMRSDSRSQPEPNDEEGTPLHSHHVILAH